MRTMPLTSCASLAALLCASLLTAMLPAAAGAQVVPTGFLDRSLTLAGERHRYQVYVPANYTPARPWPVVLFLHGAGERGADGLLQTEVGLGSAIRRHAERFPAIVVLPQARPGIAWAGPMAEMALQALDQTQEEFATDRSRVYLTGLSMGGAGTWYIAYRHPDRFAALIAICARVRPSATTVDPVVPTADGEPFAALAGRIRHLPIWVFHGDADKTVPVEESRGVVAALEALKVPVRYSELPGVGHNSWDAAYRSPETTEWLFAQRRAAP
jgi:predicted peptidase